MSTLSVPLSLIGLSFLKQVVDGEGNRWSGVESSALTPTCLGGMVQWGFGDGHTMMDSHMVMALSGIMHGGVNGRQRLCDYLFEDSFVVRWR
jgi:hypothetical protein